MTRGMKTKTSRARARTRIKKPKLTMIKVEKKVIEIDITTNGVRRSRKAHVVAYELKHGPVPEGTELDHKCRTEPCINVDHLEAVTHRENVLRGCGPTAENAAKTCCKHGHVLAGGNLRVATRHGKRYRQCLTCKRARERAYRPIGVKRNRKGALHVG